jgi:predicted RNA-binding protein YlxR (DUF448 family)
MCIFRIVPPLIRAELSIGEKRKPMPRLSFRRLADSLKNATRLLTSRRIMSREEIFQAGNNGAEPSANYQKSLDMLDNVVREGITVSQQYAGIRAPSRKHFYASVLYTALLSRSVSLLMLAPHSPWARKMIEHWDYASAAVIVRTMLEIRAAFHYLCVDQCSDEEWNCRWNLLNLHDCYSRIRLLEAKPSSEDGRAELRVQAEELKARLKTNRHFLTQKHQQRLLNGRSAYLYPLEDLLEKAALEKETYRFLNILFSSHVHGLPMSYYRMAEQNRGRGLPSPVEEGYTKICHSLAATLLTKTRDEVHLLFDGLSKQKTST